MSLPNETGVARLLREMNERDALFRALSADDSLKGLRTSLSVIETQMDTLRTVDIAKQLQAPALRAAEVAKHLQAPALKATDIAKQLQAPALRAVDIAKQLQAAALRPAEVAMKLQDSTALRTREITKRLPTVAVPCSSNSTPKTKSTETPVRTVADLGPMIRKARKAMKFNQADFAAHAGVGRRFISELEGGKGSLEFDKVIACAIVAGIDISARNRQS